MSPIAPLHASQARIDLAWRRDGIPRPKIWRFGSRFLRFEGSALVAAQ
jgi:hypothetical protein